jgi:hypothetical protein
MTPEGPGLAARKLKRNNLLTIVGRDRATFRVDGGIGILAGCSRVSKSTRSQVQRAAFPCSR